MRKLLSRQIVTEQGIVEGSLTFQGDTITAIQPESLNEAEGSEAWAILPGIIDIHTHGGGGYLTNYLANSGSIDEIRKLSRFYASRGVTSFMATVSLWSEEKMGAIMSGIADLVHHEKMPGAQILGINLEAPCFSLKKSGAGFMTPQWMPNPSRELAERFIEAGRGLLKYVTLAPELPEAQAAIETYRKAGIQVAAGHTDASSSQMKQGIEWGVRSVSHAGNAMSMIHQRDIGVLGQLMLHPEVMAELICDFIHLSPEFIQLMLQVKGSDHLCMIADASELAGLEEGVYDTQPRPVRLKPDGRVVVEGSDVLCGSSLFVIDGLRNLTSALHLPLTEAVKMSSLNAARHFQLDSRIGSLKPGKQADLIVIDKEFHVLETIVQGRTVYRQNDKIERNPAITDLKIG